MNTGSEDIKYVGVNDHKVDLFEGQYVVPRGMAYNSYFINDAKTAVMDTVDSRFGGDLHHQFAICLAYTFTLVPTFIGMKNLKRCVVCDVPGNPIIDCTNFLHIPRQAPCDGFSNGSIVIMRSVKHTISIIKMFFEHYAEIVHGYDSFSLRKALGDTPTNFLKNEPRKDWLAKLQLFSYAF